MEYVVGVDAPVCSGDTPGELLRWEITDDFQRLDEYVAEDEHGGTPDSGGAEIRRFREPVCVPLPNLSFSHSSARVAKIEDVGAKVGADEQPRLARGLLR